MTYWTRFWVFVLATAGILVSGHLWRLTTFSLIPWPLLLALLICYLPLRSWRWLLLFSVVAELLSSLPAGMMTVIMFTPWILSLWPNRPLPGISLGFFFWMLANAGVQYIFLAEFAFFWQGHDVPGVMPLMWLATSLAAYVLIASWYEALEPARRPRTQPRFKHV